MPDVVDIAEESAKFPDEWVLFQVTEVSEDDIPVYGRLLFHGRSRDDLRREALKTREGTTHAFFTGEPVGPGVTPVQ